MATQGRQDDRVDRPDRLDRPDRVDRLDLGTDAPRGRRATWWRVAGLLALGGLVGWGAHGAFVGERTHRQPVGHPGLVAGSFQQNLKDPFGPGFLISLTNTGTSPVEVLDVTPRGWAATTSPVRLDPGTAVDLPVDVKLDCGAIPPPSDLVVVRIATATGSRSVELSLPEVPPALQEEYLRRCSVDTLTTPSMRDLLGTWLVYDGGPAFTGKMYIHLDEDGRYEMDGGANFDKPGAFGRFSLADGRLVLREIRGGDCGVRHRAVWDVGLRPDGLLHIRQLTAYDGFCTVEPGDVWIATRVPL